MINTHIQEYLPSMISGGSQWYENF